MISDLTKDKEFKGKSFVYGLPELNKANIRNAEYIANPGCFATAIQLLPLAAKGLLKTDVHINATTEVLAQESAHQKRHISAGDQITCRTKHSTTSI
jgi:N-acetyl-gamma-glutamylphosphate reductase